MPGFPYAVTVEVAWEVKTFLPPTWHDLQDITGGGVVGFSTSRGRDGNTDTCSPGTLSVQVDDPQMILDPDNTSSPFHGDLRTMRQIRVTAQQTAFTTPVTLFTGYVDRISRRWPGGGAHSEVTIDATDLFKVYAKRTLPDIAFAQMDAAVRIDAIHGQLATSIAGDFNTAYAAYSLVETNYNDQNALQALNDAAVSDGGVFFIAGSGAPTFHPHGYRLTSTRSTVSQATFGNSPGAIEVENTLEPYIDDQSMANTVTVTAGDSQVISVSYGPGLDEDGPLEADLGQTLLVPTDADERAADYAVYRGQPRVNYDTVVLDAVTGHDQMTQALAREISDRVTLALTPQGGGVATSRAQFIEGVSFDVVMPDRFEVTYSLSAV